MLHLLRFVAKSDDNIQIDQKNLAQIGVLAFLLNFYIITVSEGWGTQNMSNGLLILRNGIFFAFL